MTQSLSMSDAPEPKKRKRKETVIVSQDANGALTAKTPDGEFAWKEQLTPSQKKKVAEGKPLRKRSKREVRYMYVFNGDGEKVLVPIGFNLEKLPKSTKRGDCTIVAYDHVTASRIGELVANGYTIEEIGKMPGMPGRFVIGQWIVKHEEFATLMKEARKIRAEHYADLVHKKAVEVEEENSKSSKVAIDGFKWLAAVGDPDSFGNRTKITGDPNAPVAIIVDTGIRRQDESIEADHKTIETDQDPTQDE